jgi:hypothetical protein
MRAAIRWIFEHSYLLLSVLAISCIQAAILTYKDLGKQVIATSQTTGVEITHLFISNHLKQLGVAKLLSEIASKSILLFLVQCIPVIVYEYFQSIKSKRIVALIIWLLSALASIPKLENIAGYLMSPLSSIGFFTDVFPNYDDSERFFEALESKY